MLRSTPVPQHLSVSLQQSSFTHALVERFIPTFIGHSDATLDSSDSFHSTIVRFVFSLMALASRGFNIDLRVVFPHHVLQKVSRGHTISFPSMPTLITTHIFSLLLPARLRSGLARYPSGALNRMFRS